MLKNKHLFNSKLNYLNNIILMLNKDFKLHTLCFLALLMWKLPERPFCVVVDVVGPTVRCSLHLPSRGKEDLLARLSRAGKIRALRH